MSVSKIRIIVSAVGAGLMLLVTENALAEFGLNLTKGVTETSRDVYDLHMLTLYVCTVIGVVVFGTMLWSLFHHRKSKGAIAAKFHHSKKLEVIWTTIPIMIIVGLAVPSTTVLMDMKETTDADLTIKVTGYQWRWHYQYLNEDFGFFSALAQESNSARQLDAGVDVTAIENYLYEVDNPVVVPINKKIRVLTTANDVIHSWWVPDLGWKKDAIPGFVNDNWTLIEKPGTYRGQCAELCGMDHAYMPIVLKAVEESEYIAWVESMKNEKVEAEADAEREWSMEGLMVRGQEVYARTCLVCHQAEGQGIPPAFPALTGSPITIGPAADHIDIVVNGKAGTTMQAFGPQLNDVDLAAVITYERNALGNSVGDLVQPADIAAAR